MNQRRQRAQHRAGFTLIEQVVSLSVMATLMTGLGSAIVISTHALPGRDDPLAAVVRSSQIVEQIAAELYSARTVTEYTPTEITFTVPDRNADALDETIRYAWSGKEGDPLTRRYNGNVPVEIAPSVKSFDLGYVTDSIVDTTTEETTVDDPEQILASFDGWTGLLATNLDQIIDSSNSVSEYFTITPPSDATQLRITKARVVLKKSGSTPGNFKIEIRRSLNDGTFKPAATSIGTPVTLSGTSLLSSYLWTTASFSDVIVTDFSRGDFCLMVTGSSSVSFLAQVYLNVLAPPNQVVFRWSSTSGLSWLPTVLTLHQEDLRFYVYGVYTRSTKTDVKTARDFLTNVDVTLRTHDEAQSRLQTRAQLINTPEVTGL